MLGLLCLKVTFVKIFALLCQNIFADKYIIDSSDINLIRNIVTFLLSMLASTLKKSTKLAILFFPNFDISYVVKQKKNSTTIKHAS